MDQSVNNSALINYSVDYLKRAHRVLKSLNHKSDYEDLHTYRTSLRRVLSVLKLLTNNKFLRKEIKPLLALTNELRELDVMITAFEKESTPFNTQRLVSHRKKRFKAILPPHKRKRIRSKLKISIEQLSRELLETLCTQPQEYIIDRAYAHYEISKKKYAALTKEDESDKFHQLRIEFKRARYSLEMLNSVGFINDPESEQQAKVLQDKLGELQDVANQIATIRLFKQKLKLKGCKQMVTNRKKRLRALKGEPLYREVE